MRCRVLSNRQVNRKYITEMVIAFRSGKSFDNRKPRQAAATANKPQKASKLQNHDVKIKGFFNLL